jgi:hypothetical protein
VARGSAYTDQVRRCPGGDTPSRIVRVGSEQSFVRRLRRSQGLPPQLDPAQRQAALEKAAAARRQRAELKEKLKAGSISLGELLAQGDTDDAVAKLKVVTVLESLPGVGKVKARRTMEELEISENRRVRGLGTHQRRALLAHFER